MPGRVSALTCNFGDEQKKDKDVEQLIDFVTNGDLPSDAKQARRVVALGSLCTMEQGILYFVDPRQRDRKRAV